MRLISSDCSGAEGARLVPYKTSDPDRLEVSFDPLIVRERRIERLRRTVWACGHPHRLAVPNGHRERVWFATLTLRGVRDWRPRHISACLMSVRKWCKRRGVPLRYVWVAELQQRSVLHYPLAIWLLTRIQLAMFDKLRWWPHGMDHRVIANKARVPHEQHARSFGS